MNQAHKTKWFRIFATSISISGVFVLAVIVKDGISGVLIEEMQPEWSIDTRHKIWALLLRLPIALHIIAIGMIIQKRWLSPLGKRIAWLSIVSSGVWLGIALIIKQIM